MFVVYSTAHLITPLAPLGTLALQKIGLGKIYCWTDSPVRFIFRYLMSTVTYRQHNRRRGIAQRKKSTQSSPDKDEVQQMIQEAVAKALRRQPTRSSPRNSPAKQQKRVPTYYSLSLHTCLRPKIQRHHKTPPSLMGTRKVTRFPMKPRLPTRDARG